MILFIGNVSEDNPLLDLVFYGLGFLITCLFITLVVGLCIKFLKWLIK